MRPKSLILVLLAAGCGLVAAIGVSQVLEHRNQSTEPVVEKEPILVALKDIKVNEPLDEKNLRLEDWPKEKIPGDAIRDFKEVDRQRAGTTILAGEPMRKAKFAVDKRIEEIPRGYRVVAVPADAASAAGNLLQPGDRVDVLLSITSRGATQNHLAKTILQNIRVFAVNEQWRPAEGNKSDESITARTVSLLVTPDQAEIMALASEMGGHIRLTLRNSEDDQMANTNGTEDSELLLGAPRENGNKETAERAGGILDWLRQQQNSFAKAAPAPQPEEHFTVELMAGNELKNVDFLRKSNNERWTSAGASVSVPASATSGATQPTL